jgi:hypothetical protein
MKPEISNFHQVLKLSTPQKAALANNAFKDVPKRN